MEFDGEILDSGPDYQKAKRSVLLINAIMSVLAFSYPANNDEPTLKIFDVELHQSILLFLILLFLCSAYVSFHFYIINRRAFLEHSQFVRRYGKIPTDAAIAKAADELRELEVRARVAVQACKDANAMVSSVSLPSIPEAQKYDLSEEFSRWSQTITVKIMERDFAENIHNPSEIHKIIRESLKDVQDYFAKWAAEIYNNGCKVRASEILTAEINKIDQILEIFGNDISKNLSDSLSQLEKISKSFMRLSETFAPREIVFYYVELFTVIFVIVASNIFAISRISYEIFPNNLQFIRYLLIG